MQFILLPQPFTNGDAATRRMFLTGQDYVTILIESLKFCQKEKGLKIYAWVIIRKAALAVLSLLTKHECLAVSRPPFQKEEYFS
jgi:hypothetical protein